VKEEHHKEDFGANLGQINPCKLSVLGLMNFDQFDCCWEVLEQIQECAASLESLKSHQV
jgi:hypothetical protein